jgi:hypothetical protein
MDGEAKERVFLFCLQKEEGFNCFDSLTPAGRRRN